MRALLVYGYKGSLLESEIKRAALWPATVLEHLRAGR